MTAVDDTKSNANESASKARGVERAAARPGEAFELMDDDDTPEPSAAASAAPTTRI